MVCINIRRTFSAVEIIYSFTLLSTGFSLLIQAHNPYIGSFIRFSRV